MQYTSNFNLKKPEDADFFNRTHQNDNMETLDTLLKTMVDRDISLTNALMDTKLLALYATQSPGADSALYTTPFLTSADLQTLSHVEPSSTGLKVSTEYATAINDSSTYSNTSADVCAVIKSTHNQRITSVSFYYDSTTSKTVTIKLWRCTKNATSDKVTPVELIATTSKTAATSAWQATSVDWELVYDQWYLIEFYHTGTDIRYQGAAETPDGILHGFPINGASELVQGTEYSYVTSRYAVIQLTFAAITQTSGYVISEQIEMVQQPAHVVAYAEVSAATGASFEINGVAATIASSTAITCVNGLSGYRLQLTANIPSPITTKLNFKALLANTTIRVYALCVFYY